MRQLVPVLAILLWLSGAAHAQDPKAVVDAFYRDYQKWDQADRRDWSELMNVQKGRMEPELFSLLADISDNDPRKDDAWLDFDPFTNSQMNAATIRVDPARMEGPKAFVPVFMSYRAPGHEQLGVEVVLRQDGSAWKIANFKYPARDGSPSWNLKDWLKMVLKR
ncbi:MAG: hypothetical protein AB1758_09860 [Candidatus Eremiobacterota bacterium]